MRQIKVHRIQQPRQLQKIIQNIGVVVCRQTIWRSLHANNFLVCKRPKRSMMLLKAHKRGRREWAHELLNRKIDWRSVLFSDEKLWYLDGPAVRPKVWQDIRCDPVRLPTKGTRNAAICVWGAFSAKVVPPLCILESHFNSQSYCNMLQNTLLPAVSVNRYTLFHDRLPAHQSTMTQKWLSEQKFRHVYFPAKGADMNPMENVWALMSREVYGTTKTYNSKESLAAAIEAAWMKVQQNKQLRENLARGMVDRLGEAVRMKGGWTSF